MRRLLIGLIFPIAVFGQQWSGIIDPSRAVNWSNAGVVGGIPSRTTICSTLNPGATVAQINTAIAACPNGQVVFLSAGTYPGLSGAIDIRNKQITLRGAGADQTKLVWSSTGGSCEGQPATICVEAGVLSWPGGPQHTANWTAGFSKGTTQLTLDSTTGIVPGSTTLMLDQCDDGFTTTACTGTATDTGNIFNCYTVGVCSSVGGGAGGGGRTNRSQQQQVLVTAVSGNIVTISPGLYMPNWRSGQSPQAWWSNVMGTFEGVENLSIDNSAIPGGGNSAIIFFLCYNCWATGTRSINTGRNHVMFYEAAHTTVANNYMFGTANATSLSYGVEHYIGSDDLIVNNIGDRIVSPELTGGADEGDVWAYNFNINDFYQTSAGWFMASLWEHAAGSAMDLWEGNQGSGFISEQRHGTHQFTTLFRNYLTGNQASCNGVPCNAQTSVIQDYTHTRYFNIIGNVLGTAGYHTNYSDETPSGTTGNLSIYTLGWSGNGGGTDASCCANDPYTVTSLMRWGNYDTVNAGTRFVSGEVPSGLSDGFANAVPATHTLPASFYYLAQPGFWVTPFGTPQYPPNGPDVSGGNIPNVGGFANNIPAQLCFVNTPVDTAYQNSVTITGATWSGGTVTVNANMAVISQGEMTISGVIPAGYNGTFQITGSTASTVKYALQANPGAYVSGGTVLYPNVRLFNAGNCYATSAPTSPAVLLSPTSFAFGNVGKSITSNPAVITLTNTGNATLTIMSIALGDSTNFSIASATCGGTLTAGSSCTETITFTPTTLGSFSTNLTFTTNAPTSPDNVALTGTGVPTSLGATAPWVIGR